MKLIFGLFLGLLLHPYIYAQGDTASFFLDDHFKNTQDPQATYLAKSFPQGSLFHFIVSNTKTGKLVLSSYYMEPSLVNLDGPYAVFYDEGEPRTSGQYVRNHPEGLWLKWDEYGNPTDSSIFRDGLLMRQSTRMYKDSSLFYMNIHDYVADSVSQTSFFESGTIKEKQFFQHQEGFIKTYYSTGHLATLTTYDKKGKISKRLYYSPEGAETTLKKFDAMFRLDLNSMQPDLPPATANDIPEMKGGKAAFQRYIDENARIPVFLRPELAPGTLVKFSFMLDSLGRATNVKLIDPEITGLGASIREWLRNMPFWDMKGRESYGPVFCSVRMIL